MTRVGSLGRCACAADSHFDDEALPPKPAHLLDDLANMLATGGSTVTVVPEIQRKKFAKNFWNVGFSSFATLTGYTVPALFRPPPGEGQERYAPYVWPKTKGEIEEFWRHPVVKKLLASNKVRLEESAAL